MDHALDGVHVALIQPRRLLEAIHGSVVVAQQPLLVARLRGVLAAHRVDRARPLHERERQVQDLRVATRESRKRLREPEEQVRVLGLHAVEGVNELRQLRRRLLRQALVHEVVHDDSAQRHNVVGVLTEHLVRCLYSGLPLASLHQDHGLLRQAWQKPRVVHRDPSQ